MRTRAMGTAIALVLLGACAPARPLGEPSPALRADWASTQSQAASEVLAGRYGVADKLLADFATRFPSTPEATETSYWRAVYKLDPANQTATPRDAGALFDAYLAMPLSSVHRADATALRRLATVLERAGDASAAAASAPPAAPGAGATKPDDRPSAEEVQRLRDELAKANAELDRIRRRLAQPKP